MQDKNELIQEIEKAFEHVTPPEKVTLHVAEAHDSYDYNDEKYRLNDVADRWQDVPVEHIEECQMALNYVDKVGMKFYLPAYMVWYLNKLNSGDVESDYTLYALDDYSDNIKMSCYFQERFSLFTHEQLKVCSHFVKYCAEDKSDIADAEFAKKIYKNYWKKFE